MIERINNHDNPFCARTSVKASFASFNRCTFCVFSVLSGSGIFTNKSEVHARAAPITSSSKIFVIFIKEMKSAASAGPAILQADWIIWLMPAIRISSDFGASKGTDACMAGI